MSYFSFFHTSTSSLRKTRMNNLCIFKSFWLNIFPKGQEMTSQKLSAQYSSFSIKSGSRKQANTLALSTEVEKSKTEFTLRSLVPTRTQGRTEHNATLRTIHMQHLGCFILQDRYNLKPFLGYIMFGQRVKLFNCSQLLSSRTM